MADQSNIITRLEYRRKVLKDELSTWRAHWKDISDYILPFHGRYLGNDDETENDGRKRHTRIFDSTATDALDITASGMQSGLTSPSRPWFRLATPDQDMMDFEPVKAWLFQVERIMRFVFSRSNVYQALHQTYMELAGFCTGCMMVLEDYEKVIRCRSFTAGEYMLACDDRGVVDTFYRRFELTARNLVSKFGEDAVPAGVLSQYKTGNSDHGYKVIHVVEPNDDRVAVLGARGMPWRSVYYLEAGHEGRPLDVGGFKSFPVLAPRWAVVGRGTYGFGPGMKILGDVKMLQKMQEKSLVALDKSIDPPVKTSDKHAIINTMPGGITYDPMTNGQSSLAPLYEVRPDIQANEFKIERVQYAIRRGLYNDLFLMLQEPDLKRKPLTATEVAERHEEKLLMLGPVLERLHAELLDPLIDRTFAVMIEHELLPEAPTELQGVELRVEYISILAQAQKMVALSGIEQLTGYVGNLAGVLPSVLDHFDEREALEQYADGLGVAPKILRTPEEVAEIQKARAERQSQMDVAAMAQQMATAAKTMADTDMTGPTALNALAGGGA